MSQASKPDKISNLKKLWLLPAPFLIVLVDQWVKAWVVGNMMMFEKRDFIPGLLSLYRTANTGAGWSMLDNAPRFLLPSVSILACLFMVWVAIKNWIEHPIGLVALSLVFGGAVGNLVDRLTPSGEVVDMFRFEFINFPIFNVADIFISIGGVCFVIYLIIFSRKKAPDAAVDENGH